MRQSERIVGTYYTRKSVNAILTDFRSIIALICIHAFHHNGLVTEGSVAVVNKNRVAKLISNFENTCRVRSDILLYNLSSYHPDSTDESNNQERMVAPTRNYIVDYKKYVTVWQFVYFGTFSKICLVGSQPHIFNRISKAICEVSNKALSKGHLEALISFGKCYWVFYCLR